MDTVTFDGRETAMGRMADMLRQAERVSAILPEEPPQEAESAEDILGDSIPYVEIGGPRMISSTTRPMPRAAEVTPAPAAVRGDDGADGIFAIRFEPVHSGLWLRHGFGPELVAYHQPEHPVSGQYHSLRDAITAQLPGMLPRVLLFTSVAPSAGTTTVLLNLAVTIARLDGPRVTVVDANWQRASVAERLGLPAAPGLREVMSRNVPLAWAVQESRQPNLSVLSAGKRTTPHDGETFAAVIDQLRHSSDWVLIDASHWGDGSETIPLAESCDAVYLIERETDADTGAAGEVQAAILEQCGRLRGCVFTGR
jgi:Mrp family chromosome partitioning ATPase